MDCVTIGDSIAVGIGHAAACYRMAAIGRNAFDQAALIKPVSIDTAIISLGTNRPNDPNTYVDLMYIRSKVTARRVVWIIPYNPVVSETVRKVARHHGDRYVELSDFKTSDGMHPNVYKPVADAATKD